MGYLAKRNQKVNDEFPSVFGNFFNTDWLGNAWDEPSMLTVPPLNINETAETYEIELAAPGYKKADFKVELNNNQLTIMVEKSTETKSEEGRKVQKREFHYQGFKRSILLPFKSIDEEQITASYTNGMLKVNIQKPEEMKERPPRSIVVK